MAHGSQDLSRTPEELRRRTRRAGPRRALQIEPLEARLLLAQAGFVADEILVQFHPGVSAAERAAVRADSAATLLPDGVLHPGAPQAEFGAIEHLKLSGDQSVADAIDSLSRNPLVAFAEPNWIYETAVVPNDTYYTSDSLWGMYGDQSSPANAFGSQAAEAWASDVIGSSDIYIGVIDEGIQWSHPDLQANIWTNPFDIDGDGIDNDGNGYIDDVHGWDFYNGDKTIYDGTVDDHGTHVAGTVGAVGNNGQGVAGVSWNVKLISGKFLGSGGGTTANAINAVDYMTDLKTRHDLNIVATSNSWGGGGFSQSLLDAIERAADAGILFIAAAGNNGSNNDTTAFYPASYDTTSASGYDAVIAVAAINSAGGLASFSNYGASKVELGAPGVGVVSTVPNNSYASYSGTSMATPHVSGSVALYASQHPTATAQEIRSALLSSTIATPSLTGKTSTGGRLDVANALGIVPGSSVAINDITLVEGNAGTSQAIFTLTRVGSTAAALSVSFATSDGTATAGSDYVAASGTATIAAGQTTTTIAVTINGDNLVEPNETFNVNLSDPVGGTISDALGVGTISNDDAPLPALSINDESMNEGQNGTRSMRFTVTLTVPSNSSVTVQFLTANDTATAGSDYTAASGTLHIPAGQTKGSILVTIIGDRIQEVDETFVVNLSNASGATIADPQSKGTIRNDDGRKSLSVSGGRAGSDRRTLQAANLGPLVDAAIDDWQNVGFDARTSRPGVRGRVDLLNVLTHEFGHLLGFEHSDHAGDIMSKSIRVDERRAAGMEHVQNYAPIDSTTIAQPEAMKRRTRVRGQRAMSLLREAGVLGPIVDRDLLREAKKSANGSDD
jgi:subtilisin family serine protease